MRKTALFYSEMYVSRLTLINKLALINTKKNVDVIDFNCKKAFS